MDGDDNAPPVLAQGIARRLIPIRWQKTHKLAGYYDPESHALIYQDARGNMVDRVDLPAVRAMPLPSVVE